MGGLMMKKVLTVLLLLVIFTGFTVGDKASATLDEMPKLARTFSLPIDDISQLK